MGFYTVFTTKTAVAKGVVRAKICQRLRNFLIFLDFKLFYGIKTHTYNQHMCILSAHARESFREIANGGLAWVVSFVMVFMKNMDLLILRR
jgi:hypothetical protein